MPRSTSAGPRLAIIVWAIALAAACHAIPAIADRRDNVIDSFKVCGDGDLLLLPVSIDDRDYQFVLDTGCTTNVFDTSLKPALKRLGRSMLLNGTMREELYESPGVCVGQTHLPVAGSALCLDLSGFREAAGRDIRGILGMEFLGKYVLHVDFDGERVRFLKTTKGVAGERLRMAFNSQRMPTILLDLPGVGTKPFVIDTFSAGFTNGGLSTKTFDALLRQSQITDVVELRTFAIGGVSNTRAGTLSRLSVGETVHVGEEFDEAATGLPDHLGLGYLSRYKLTFDFPNGVLHLEKGKQFERRFPRDGAGIWLVVHAEQIVVRRIENDKMGFQCGIREGDFLLEVDGGPTRGMTAYAVERVLRERPEGRRLKIARPPKREPIQIILERTPSPNANSLQLGAQEGPPRISRGKAEEFGGKRRETRPESVKER